MNFAEIENLVRRGESDELEFKTSTGQLSRAAETLCGFLNQGGGTVLFGISPAGQIVGQIVRDGTQRDVAQILKRFEPPPVVRIWRVPIPQSDHEVLALVALDSRSSRPFTFDGRPYERIGATTSVMRRENYQRLLLESAHSTQRWERLPAAIALEDLDRDEILKTLRLGVAAGRLSPSLLDDPGDALDRMGLRVDGRILNAAAVVFGRRLLVSFPQCQLRMARFRGTDKTEFLDQRQACGHALLLLEEAVQFLTRHLPVSGRIEPGLFERIDSPLFPPVALREALVNAFCHRDYSIEGGAVSLAIFDDRMEVWSDGTLPFGLKVDDLKRDHLSRPRNPLIAEVFYRRGLIERWGRGTQKIVELCLQAGHPEPEFIEQAGAVGVRFLPSGYTAPHRIAHDLTTRQRRILQVLADRQEAGFSQLRSSIAPTVAVRTFRDDLLHLKRLGLLGLRGRGRGATWYLAERPDEEGQNRAE